MLARFKRLLAKVEVGIRMCTDDHKLDVGICKEVLWRTIVLCIGVVNSAMLSGLYIRLVLWRLCSLQEGDHFQIRVWEDEWQVEDLGGSTIADDTYVDSCHDRGRRGLVAIS